MTPSYANLFLGYFEANTLENAPFQPHTLLRYIDPIFMIWTKGLDNFSLLADVSHDEAKWNERRETSAGFWRVVSRGRWSNFWPKLTGFQNQFRLMCNAWDLLDCTVTIIEPTAYVSFKISHFDWAKKLSVSALGDKRIKNVSTKKCHTWFP